MNVVAAMLQQHVRLSKSKSSSQNLGVYLKTQMEGLGSKFQVKYLRGTFSSEEEAARCYDSAAVAAEREDKLPSNRLP